MVGFFQIYLLFHQPSEACMVESLEYVKLYHKHHALDQVSMSTVKSWRERSNFSELRSFEAYAWMIYSRNNQLSSTANVGEIEIYFFAIMLSILKWRKWVRGTYS